MKPSGTRATRDGRRASTSPPALCPASRVSTMGVCIWPGTTVLTLIRRGAYSTAVTREKWITPAFVEAYPTWAEPVHRKPDVEAVLTIDPPPAFSISGTTYLQVRKTVFRLKLI